MVMLYAYLFFNLWHTLLLVETLYHALCVYMHLHVHIMYFCMCTRIQTHVCQRVYNYIFVVVIIVFSHHEVILCFYCKHRVFHVRA